MTEIIGAPDYHRPATVRHEVEAAGLRFVDEFGSFLPYTLNLEKSAPK